MRVGFAIVCLLLGIGQNSRAAEDVLHWMPVKKVCGRLRSEKRRGAIISLPRIKITLYEAKWRTACCQALKSITSRVTSEGGDFDFGSVGDGRYWLAIELGGKDFRLPMDVNAKHDWEGVCENQGPIIEKDSVAWIAGRGVE
jgi:hypothetical protein